MGTKLPDLQRQNEDLCPNGSVAHIRNRFNPKDRSIAAHWVKHLVQPRHSQATILCTTFNCKLKVVSLKQLKVVQLRIVQLSIQILILIWISIKIWLDLNKYSNQYLNIDSVWISHIRGSNLMHLEIYMFKLGIKIRKNLDFSDFIWKWCGCLCHKHLFQ